MTTINVEGINVNKGYTEQKCPICNKICYKKDIWKWHRKIFFTLACRDCYKELNRMRKADDENCSEELIHQLKDKYSINLIQ